MSGARCIVITGSMIAPAAASMMRENSLRAVVVPGVPSSTEIAEAVRKNGAVGLIVRTGVVDEAVLTASDRLRVVAKHGVGIDNVDMETATRHGIAVMTTRDVSSTSVAEHALALMLSVAKRISFLDRRMRAGHWDKPVHRGLELTGKSVVLIGYGRIARQLAKLLQPLDVRITAVVRRVPEGELTNGVRFASAVNDVIADADVISVHCPLTDLTRNLISSEQFDLMKPTAIFINTARGGIVDERALIKALKSKRLYGAGLDCLENEPPATDSELLALPNVVVTPHVAWATEEAAERKGCMAVCNILTILDECPIDIDFLANPAVLDHPSHSATQRQEPE